MEKKEKLTRYTILLAGAIIALAIIIGVGTLNGNTIKTAIDESTIEKIEKTGTVDLCYIELSPTVIKDPKTGELSGIFIEMAEEIFSSFENVEIRWHSSTWGTFPADLQSKRCDLVVAASFVIISKAKVVSYSRPIAYTGNSAVVKKGSGLENIKNIEEFDRKDITVAVLNGEFGHIYVQENFQNAEIRVIQGADDTLPLIEVLSGRADVGLHESVVVSRFVEEHPEELVDVFKDNPYNQVQIAWATRSDDPEWTRFISTSIDVLETSGKIDELEDKYDMYWFREKKELISS